jgi:tetratricopeptide (TPR) repeat protein
MAQVPLDQAVALATKFQTEGNLAEAEKIWRLIAAATPNSAPTLNRLGVILGMQHRYADARANFERAVQIDPAFSDAWGNLALACENLKDYPAAISSNRQHIALRPDAAESWHRLGVALGKSGDLPAAIEALWKSIDLNPESASILNDLVLALSRHRQSAAFEPSAPSSTNPSSEIGPTQIAGALKKEGSFREWIDIWRRIVRDHPENPDLHGQLAMSLLAEGNFEEGWKEYEWRWRCKTFAKNTRRPIAREWGNPEGADFPDVAGRTLLLYCEQGIGDTIQFIRYARVLAERGARVIVEGQWPLKGLLSRSEGVRLSYGKMEKLPAYDWHIPLLNLPRALNATLENIPAKIPYITADPSRAKTWKPRIDEAAKGATLKVGLAWAGNPEHKNDAHRSIDPALLLPLADIHGIRFFSLQKAGDNKNCPPAPAPMQIVDFTSKLYDFAETAALIDQLDLVISVDTAIVHLGGAMGKRVWTLLSSVSDFRWLMNREDSPWYPTMRLFRQSRFDEWEEPVARVKLALEELVQTHPLRTDPLFPSPGALGES